MSGGNSITLNDLGYSAVGIELNNNCNMACTFCPLPIRKAGEAALEIEDVRRILDQVAADGTVDLISFSQFNEPFLYPQLWECIDMATERGFRTLVITNGATFTERNLKNLLAHPLTMLRISAQCIKEENHNLVRGYEGRFSTYIKGLARALAVLIDEDHSIEEVQCDLAIRQLNIGWKRKLSVAFGMSDVGDPTIFDETPETLTKPLADFLKMVEAESSTFTYDRDQHLENLRQLGRSGHVSFDLAYALSENVIIAYKQFVNGRRIENYQPVEYGQCRNSYLGILANGAVTLCCYDYDGFTTQGNVREEALSDILQRGRPVIENLRRGGQLPCVECKKCLGSPTVHGAAVRTVRNYLRFGGDNTKRPLPPTIPFRTLD